MKPVIKPLPATTATNKKSTGNGSGSPVKKVASGTSSPSTAKIGSDKFAPQIQAASVRLEAREKLLTPFRMVVATIVVSSSLTGWGLWHRHRVEVAKSILFKAAETGMQALQDRDFVGAARKLEQARQAVDLLRRTDPESQFVRRLCREAIAARGLATDSLFNLLHESLADINPGSRDAKRFDGLHAGSWVLFDCTVPLTNDDEQPCVLDMPTFHRGQPIRIEANFASLRQALRQASSEGPARVIFAAQLERLTPSAGEMPQPVLTLNNRSAFLWTTYETYVALGYHPYDAEEQKQTQAILDTQLEVTEEMK